ncbi:MAG: hypothetical protein WCE30_00920 [Mycobacterium sp.]
MVREKHYVNAVVPIRLPQYRFGITMGGAGQQRWHAIDLKMYGPRIVEAQARGAGVDIFSVCVTRSDYVRPAGQFTYGSRYLRNHRCERCGWVVALNRGTVEQEIDLYTADAAGADHGALRQIFIAILADLPPGAIAESGHRSDLLAHAARHRPAAMVCDECAHGAHCADVHGPGVTRCPDTTLVCWACTFTAGPWGGDQQGMATGECVVSAPCSVLGSLARHYDIAFDGPWGSR